MINPNESIVPNKEISLPSGSNPQDVAFVNSSYLYIVFYNLIFINNYKSILITFLYILNIFLYIFFKNLIITDKKINKFYNKTYTNK